MREIPFPLNRQASSLEVANLIEALEQLVDRRGIALGEGDAPRELRERLRRERLEHSYGEVTARLVSRLQAERKLKVTGEVDEATAAALNGLLQDHGLLVPLTRYRVQGRVTSQTSAALGDLRVVVIDRGVGGDTALAEARTDGRGAWKAEFPNTLLRRRGKAKPDLQARAYSGERLLGSSAVRYDASTDETLDLILDDKASRTLASEYETLMSGVAVHYQGRLSALQETDEHPDITYLASKSGWDARAVAIAALADQLSERSALAPRGARIETAFFYALLRAGLPADEAVIYGTDANVVGRIWKRAVQDGTLPAALAERLEPALKRFQELSAARLLSGKGGLGPSSLSELLSPTLGEDPEAHRRFAEIYTQYHGAPEKLWASVGEAFGAPAAQRLRVDGQLGYLTLNNAPLVRQLNALGGQRPIESPAQLVSAGLHRPEAWRRALGDGAVPAEISGRDEEERRQRYAELMAAQVRLSYPTATLAQRIGAAEIPMQSEDLRGAVHGFLDEHQAQFQIGAQPIRQYVAQRQLDVPSAVIGEISRIQRVYQMTPDDASMVGLLKAGVDSSAGVLRYDREEFVGTFAETLGGEQVALSVHAKATQVHAATLNIAYAYLATQGAAPIGVHGVPLIVDPGAPAPANAGDVLASATLDQIFGEMDYCACEHCRSVLSPAAYLVDLLLFIDRPSGAIPAGFHNPLSVLEDRRPDIANLPLTCENTNTPLPYIDLVNETLEYYVTHTLSLTGFTGHTTDGSVPPEELLASPQFVTDTAYATLAGESFPPPLPFHQPLESLRRHYARFDAPLPQVMADLRRDDSLERASDADYGWRDVWMETLGLSRAEHLLLTRRQTTLGVTNVSGTVKRLYGFADATTEAALRATLENARSLCRRVGISEQELVDLLRTRFINPSASLIPQLERLGVPFATLAALKAGTLSDAAFSALLAPGLDPARYGGDIAAWVKRDDNYRRIMSLLTLRVSDDPEDACSFEEVELRYANPDDSANRVRLFEFVRLIRFVRIWKRLGLSIEQTDRVLGSLYPASRIANDPSDTVNLERLDEGFLTFLPRLGVAMRAAGLLGLSLPKDLPALLACFAPIDSDGETSLYRTMFLGPSRLDGAFADDGYGAVLTSNSEKLLAHADALRGAFSLTASEFGEITTALAYDASTPLSLETISAVFRRGWLARRLRLSVRELLLLSRLAGLDPFEVPDPTASALLRLLDLVQGLRAMQLKPVAALYLIWNQDLSGASAPPDSEISAFARTLRGALSAIEGEFALVDDPGGTIARSRMALVYGDEATNLFFGLLDRTFVSAVTYGHAAETLEQPILDAVGGRIRYDDLRKQLSFAGVLGVADRDALLAVPGVAPAFLAAVGDLYTENQSVVEPFFARFPELAPLHDAYASSADPVETRRSTLLQALLPELKIRRKRQAAIQLVSGTLEADLDLVTAALEDPAVLHAEGATSRPAIDDLLALERGGLTARISYGAAIVSPPDIVREAEASLSYAPGANPLPPNGSTPGASISGLWSGQLEAPENGYYNVRIDADPASTVTLTLAGAPVALTGAAGSWRNSAPIDLRAGSLYAISLRVEGVEDGLVVRWQRAGSGWEVVPAPRLYSDLFIDNMRRVYVRLLKAAELRRTLKLTTAELSFLAAHADYQISGSGWLNHLPVLGDPGAEAPALGEALGGLLDFARMKARLAPNDERLLSVMRNPVAATSASDSLLFVLSRWEKSSIDLLLTRFGLAAADLGHVARLARVHDAQRWVSALGIPASALVAATTNEPTGAGVRALQAALRARYDQDSWLDVLKPINDALRSLQRDALVAYILHQMRSTPASSQIDTPERLYEYFLMDVQMEPCMLTSRVRNALSAVQLFVDRCVMNLEPRVSPSSIQAGQWEWMKRYRVWEANRKVFLYPENWLEPELRDDQSPFYKEAMSELLQGDITEERAAQALMSYLTRLEDVARLEVCAVHYEQKDPGLADDVAHVIARTFGANRKYFYRTRSGGAWSPWEKVSLDIEDNPVLPVVWKGRLFLFWLKITMEPTQSQPSTPSGDHLADVAPSDVFSRKRPSFSIRCILTWSERLHGKWQPARTSDPAQPLDLGIYELGSSKTFSRGDIKLSSLVWSNGGLRVIVSSQVGQGSSFFLYTPAGAPELRSAKKGAHFQPKRTIDTSSSALQISYAGSSTPHAILTNELDDGAIGPNQQLDGEAWEAPFFYQDRRHAFYVTAEERLVLVPEWTDPGVIVSPRVPRLEIPPVRFKPEIYQEVLPEVPVPLQPGFGVVDPAPYEPYLFAGPTIDKAIGTTGTVRFGDKNIGPTGSQTVAPRTR